MQESEAVIDQNMQTIIWINNSRTVWHNEIFNVIFEFHKHFASACLYYFSIFKLGGVPP